MAVIGRAEPQSLAIEFQKSNPIVYLGTIGVGRQTVNVAKSNPVVSGTLTTKEEEFIFTDLSKKIEADFMNCLDGDVPSNLKGCQSILEEVFKQNNGLNYFELPNEYKDSDAYAVEFLAVDDITRTVAQHIGEFDEEYVGYYNTNLIAKVLGVSIESCNKIQGHSPGILGELIIGKKHGLEQLADVMLSQEKYTLKTLIGDLYNGEDGIAHVIKYGGKMYYYWFSY